MHLCENDYFTPVTITQSELSDDSLDKEIVKAKNFMVQSNVTHSYIKVKDLKNREPMYV